VIRHKLSYTSHRQSLLSNYACIIFPSTSVRSRPTLHCLPPFRHQSSPHTVSDPPYQVMTLPCITFNFPVEFPFASAFLQEKTLLLQHVHRYSLPSLRYIPRYSPPLCKQGMQRLSLPARFHLYSLDIYPVLSFWRPSSQCFRGFHARVARWFYRAPLRAPVIAQLYQ
jgi:hypothetical protein